MSTEVRKIEFISSISSYSKLCNQYSCMTLIEAFLKMIHIAHAEQSVRAITWIELYILYRISGNPQPLEPKASTVGDRAKQAISLDLQLRHFKNQVRKIAERALSGGRDADIFKPMQITHDNLIGIGITGHHPAVAFNVSLTQNTQLQVNKSLILLGMHVSHEKLMQIAQGSSTTRYNVKPLSYRGKTGWDSRLITYHGTLDPLQDHINTNSHPCDIDHTSHQKLMFVVQCPTCNQQSPCHNYKFQYSDLDAKIRCSECHKFSAVKYWKCNCAIIWHTCKVHHCAEKVKPSRKDKLRSSGKNESSIQKSFKRLHENASFDKLLDDDLRAQTKRAKQLNREDQRETLDVNSIPTTQLRSSMLSPNLRQKFAYLIS